MSCRGTCHLLFSKTRIYSLRTGRMYPQPAWFLPHMRDALIDIIRGHDTAATLVFLTRISPRAFGRHASHTHCIFALPLLHDAAMLAEGRFA